MRQKKIRGHKRRWKSIENWRIRNLEINLKDFLIDENDRYYVKIGVHPWSSLSFTNSLVGQPRGKTKEKMLSGLLDIYKNWKQQLDKLGKPYYLKIWLFETHFAQSQVVCALGDSIHFYNNTFFKPENNKKLNSDNYGQLKNRIENFTWDYHLDEVHYDNITVGEPEIYASKEQYEESKKWFEKLLKKPYRIHKFKKPIGNATESYSFKRGDIWLGGEK